MRFNVALKILLILLANVFAQDTIANLRIEKKDGVHFVDGVELGKKLKMQMLWQSEANILQIGTSSWALGNAWASTKDTSFLLQNPVQNEINGKRSFWLPLPSSLPIFERMLNRPIGYDSASAKITMGQIEELKDIWKVNLEAKDNGEVLELKFSKSFVSELYKHSNYYILRINGAVMDSMVFQDAAKKSTLISRIISIQDKQSAQLTLILKDNCENVELAKKDEGKTLQLVLRKKQVVAKPAAPTPSAAQANRKIKTIVIDPGHGGKDPGAIGHKGLKEKEVVLEVG
jgi:hypothetical protein